MGELGAIEEDVVFDHDAADSLSMWLGYLADCLESQADTDRDTARDRARETWEGRYAQEFDDRIRICTADAEVMALVARDARDGLDELARLAREEQDRREAARDWLVEVQESQDDSGWQIGGATIPGTAAVADVLHGDDLPEPPDELTEAEPPSILIGEPETASQRDPQVIDLPTTYADGGTSSAAPDDLDAFASDSRDQDDLVSSYHDFVEDHHDDFQAGCGWGHFDCSSLISAVGTWLGLNELDAQWVEEIAGAFRDADSGEVPDSVIEARLNSAGLDGQRGAVVFDSPVAWGASPTSGFADDPVNAASGNFVEVEHDLTVTGMGRLLSWSRIYNSRSDRNGPFGPGWSSWASCRLWAEPDGAHWVGPDGQEKIVGRATGPGPEDDGVVRYNRSSGLPGRVVVDGDGLALVGGSDGNRMVFDAAGRPVSRSSGPGTAVRHTYDGDRLVAMAHENGRRVQFTWAGRAGRDRIVGLSCSDGRAVSYVYDDEGRLVGATGGPDGSRTYEVDSSGRVVAVVDADGVVEARNAYDDEGKVTDQVSPFGRRSRYRYLAGQVTMVDDHDDGPRSTFIHDDDRLVGLVDAHGNELRKEYDLGGNPERLVDRDGAVTHLEWDLDNRLTRRRNPDGSWFTFGHDDAGRVTEVVASTGATTSYRYDGDEHSPSEIVDGEGGVTRLDVRDGLVHRIVDPDGVEVRFRFDADGELTSVTDAAGNTAVVERDPAGRVVATISPMGRRTEIVYDEAGRPVERHDPDGAVWRFGYSPAGRLTAVVDPLGNRRERRYGANGRPEESVDESGGVTSRSYDTLGNLVRLVLPDGAKWDYGYDRLGRLTTIDDPEGATWLREYDVCGRLVGSVDPLGTQRTVTHDEAGRVASVDDGLTSVTFDYDELGRAVTHRRPDGSAMHTTYDACGRRTTVTNPDGGVTRYEHSPGGRVVSVTTPLGHTTRYEYDNRGWMTAVVDPVGACWAYRYDGDGLVTQVIAPTGETTRYRYDAAGRMTARISSTGGTTRYTYDLAGRVVAVTDPTDGVTTLRWGPRGELSEAVDPLGNVTRYEHDARGQLRAVTDPLGSRVTHRYDAAGRRTATTDQLGRTTRWEYDAAGNLTRRTLPTGEEVRWWYDASGRVKAVGTSDGEIITYRRDVLGRPVVVDEPGFRHELAWDALGRLVAKRINGTELQWDYDPDGRRTAVRFPEGTETRFTHDPAGRPTTARHPGLGTVEFAHDAAGRLTRRSSPQGTRSWRYEGGDLVGYASDGSGGSGGTHTSLERDAAGRVVSATTDGRRVTYGYDAAGQLITADSDLGRWDFAYDANGRLASETPPDGAQVAYRYDPAHQLLERQVGEPGAGDGTTRFTYDEAGRRTTATSPDRATRTYEWDWLGRLCRLGNHELGVDAFDDLSDLDGSAMLWDPVGAVPQPRWYDGTAVVGTTQPWATVHPDGTAGWLDHDWQGSVTGPDRPAVSAAGPAAGTGGADPWGAGQPTGGTQELPTLGYRGELTVDGHTWLRHRVYDPSTRSFCSTDPLAGAPGTAFSANSYHYAGNNPVGALDPFGLSPMTDAEFMAHLEANYDDGVVGWAQDRWDDVTDWWDENWEYVVATALVVGGVVVMATGVGGPVGAAMIGGGMMAAGTSAGVQQYTTGEVDWSQVAVDGAIGAAAGGAGAWVGGATATSAPMVRISAQVGTSTVTNVAGGAGSRAYAGQDPWDPQALAFDTVVGAGTGGLGARLQGRQAPVPDRLPQDINVNPVPPRPLPINRPVGRPSHNSAVLMEAQRVQGLGAQDIRVNQQQVNAAGQRMGTNRPDLQYTLNGQRYYLEIEAPTSPRGPGHQQRILSNDPSGQYEEWTIP